MKVHAAKPEVKGPDVNSSCRQWTKDLVEAQAKRRDDAARAQVEAQSKAESISAFGERLRRAVLSGEKVSDFWKAARNKRPQRTDPPPAAEDSSLPSCGPLTDANKLASDMIDFVNEIYVEAAESLKSKAKPVLQQAVGIKSEDRMDVSKTSEALPEVTEGTPSSDDKLTVVEADKGKPKRQREGGSSSRRRPKAAWALSEGEAAAAQEEEERELLEFAENLDFTDFVDKLDDVELNETFKVMHG